MVMYKGGTVVKNGLYWSPIDGRQVTVREAGMLPGDENRSFLRISPLLLLFIAPLFGMMYVMFLPLLGIGVFLISWLVPVAGTLVSAASTGFRVCSGHDSLNRSSTWNPSRAYFSGDRKKVKKNNTRPAVGRRKQ